MRIGPAEFDDRQEDAGASAVEYGLIVFAIAALIAVVVFALGVVVGETYSGACEDLVDKAESSEDCE